MFLPCSKIILFLTSEVSNLKKRRLLEKIIIICNMHIIFLLFFRDLDDELSDELPMHSDSCTGCCLTWATPSTADGAFIIPIQDIFIEYILSFHQENCKWQKVNISI